MKFMISAMRFGVNRMGCVPMVLLRKLPHNCESLIQLPVNKYCMHVPRGGREEAPNQCFHFNKAALSFGQGGDCAGNDGRSPDA
jgi:hypothetical protein